MDPDPQIRNSESVIRNRGVRVTRAISLWFALQVLLNIAIALYLTLHPPDEPVSWFGRVDLTVNTGVNAALAVGFWRQTPWVWATAVWLVPLYWALHAWHMLIPAEGVLLWPFLLVDAVILAWLLGSRGREALGAPRGRYRGLALALPVMAAAALYAALAPFLGLFVAAPVALAAVLIGLKRTISSFRSRD